MAPLSDSSLLWDCVRVLVRLMTKAKGTLGTSFNSRRRRAKRRAIGILNAKSKEQRTALYRDLLTRVVDQTERRVLRGESVPATQKLVSIFEPHTDIIIKDRRDTFYGHKICLTSGASGLVLDVVMEEGNPSDSTLGE